MTYLDDALNSSSITLYPTNVVATWNELEPGYSGAGGTGFDAADSIQQMAYQVGPSGITVTHSIDDGLPDPVTVTGNNEASGVLQMDLAGRPPATAAMSSLGWNALTTTGSGQGLLITTTFPTDLAFWDYVICAVTLNSTTALISEVSMPADTLWPWKLLASSTDGAFTTYVYGRKHYTLGVVPPQFSINATNIVPYTWVMGSLNVGRTPSLQVLVPVTPGDIETAAESASVTTHNQTPVTIGNRGWNVGVFGGAAASGPWTSAGNTIVAQVAGTICSTALVTSPMRQVAGVYPMSANSNAATNVVTMIHLALEVRDRPAMDAVNYFSTFNSDSPIYGFERDTALVRAAVYPLPLDGSGLHSNLIYTGQMSGISVDGRSATMDAVSGTRLLLDNSYVVPTVYGYREGCTTDWLAGYLLAKGGEYIGVPPSANTRWWAPMYGSAHPYMDGSAGYMAFSAFDNSQPVRYRVGGQDTTGPYATAMFCQQTDKSVIRLTGTADRDWATEVPGIPNPVMADIFSKQNSKGQFTMMIRLDPFTANPSVITTGNPDDKLLFSWTLWHRYLGLDLPGVKINLNTDGSFNVWLGSQTSNLVGGGVVADGNWHFIGYQWDYANATGLFRFDDVVWNPINGNSNLDTLPNDDATMIASGGYNEMTFAAQLPVAEMQLETGINDLSRFRPAPAAGVTYRPSRQPLAAIANTTPIQGWSTLQALAQSTLSHLRVDESDNAMLVTLDYFGEAAQMAVSTLNVLDTDFNAAQPNAIDDPSLTRNVVTIQFTDTSVGSQRSTILEMNTSLAIPRGVTLVTFTLDTPTAETHGAAQWWTSTPEFQKLTAAQVAGTTAIQNENVMTVNTLPDGSGTVFTSTAFVARIVDWDANSIVVQFTNTYSTTLYLANNGTQIPFLRALGYAITTADGYVTVRDSGSIGTRRERALTAQMDWITDRETAQEVATKLVTLLSRPRPVLTVTVQGDPRRVPGTLCQLVDSTGLQADGTWRIYRIQHNINGPQYTQDLTLIRVGEIANWDEGTWDETVWGE